MAQSVKHLTLDFGSGRDLMVVSSSPKSCPTLSVEPAWDSLSPSLSLPLTHSLTFSLSLSLSLSLSPCSARTESRRSLPPRLETVIQQGVLFGQRLKAEPSVGQGTE